MRDHYILISRRNRENQRVGKRENQREEGSRKVRRGRRKDYSVQYREECRLFGFNSREVFGKCTMRISQSENNISPKQQPSYLQATPFPSLAQMISSKMHH